MALFGFVWQSSPAGLASSVRFPCGVSLVVSWLLLQIPNAIVCFVGLLEVDLQLLCAVILFSFWREVWSVGFLRPACWSFCSWILFRQACWDVSAVDVSLALPDCFAVCPTGFCC
ncbi:hypothetical protein Peur_018996 [Populus x canadensis]